MVLTIFYGGSVIGAVSSVLIVALIVSLVLTSSRRSVHNKVGAGCPSAGTCNRKK